VGHNKKEKISGFYGEFQHTLDNKSRIFIPAKLREAFLQYGNNVVLSRGLDKCLYLFPYKEWKVQIEEKTKSLPLTARGARAYTRHLFSGASPHIFDSQGRIPLSSQLKDYAQIRKEVVIIGVANRVEVWSKQIWQKYFKETDSAVEDIADNLREFGI